MNVPPDFPLNLNLPAKDVDLALQGLGQLPYNMVEPVINRIRLQIQSQLAIHEAAVKELGSGQSFAPGPSE